MNIAANTKYCPKHVLPGAEMKFILLLDKHYDENGTDFNKVPKDSFYLLLAFSTDLSSNVKTSLGHQIMCWLMCPNSQWNSPEALSIQLQPCAVFYCWYSLITFPKVSCQIRDI